MMGHHCERGDSALRQVDRVKDHGHAQRPGRAFGQNPPACAPRAYPRQSISESRRERLEQFGHGGNRRSLS